MQQTFFLNNDSFFKCFICDTYLHFYPTAVTKFSITMALKAWVYPAVTPADQGLKLMKEVGYRVQQSKCDWILSQVNLRWAYDLE